jgi:uncharacterized protein GlcG (DUF336 family)
MPGTQRGRSRRLQIERLESRTLPAVTAAVNGAGALVINGDTNRDLIRVELNPTSGQYIVLNNFQTVGVFSYAAVTSIVVNAGPGKGTVVRIDPNVPVPTVINGGNGGDVLQGGGGPTTLLGGAGNDKLIAGPGKTLLNGDGGINHLQNVKPIDTAILGPLDTITHAVPVIVNTPPPDLELTPADVQNLLDRAAASNNNQGAIIVVMDRGGRLLGVRVENGVALTGATLNFAIDGAMAEARTAAFFANGQLPITSRTVQFISQSTMTQREIESIPSLLNAPGAASSTIAGPGFVAPIEIGGHFPPGVSFTPQVDLYDIEATNRDSTIQHTAAGPVLLPARFNINPAFIPPADTTALPSLIGVPPSQYLTPPNSYSFLLNPKDTNAVGRGIGTLPGGIPIYKTDGNGNVELVGGIGIFFPGKTGFADEENSNLSANYDVNKPDLAAEAEAMAFAAVGGAPGVGLGIGSINGVPQLSDLSVGVPLTPQNMRVDLVGITLNVVGPLGINGPQIVFNLAEQQILAAGLAGINASNIQEITTAEPVNNMGALYLAGRAVPSGWLVAPHDGVGITAGEVNQIIQQGIAQANLTRAAIRLPLNSTTKMVFAVCDVNGNIVGLYRMPDATIFSIAVAVAKARNVAYYNNAAQLQPIDQLPGVVPGTALTNRSFRYLAEPRFPEGIDGAPPGPFSILNDGGTDPRTGLNIGPPLPASAFNSVQGHNAFVPDSNFHDPFNPLNQDGIVFFPGSSGVYTGGNLIGGFGVSGDGVDQDDVVTTLGIGPPNGFAAPLNIRIDNVFVRGIRVPYSKFNRNPEGGIIMQ